MVQKEVNIGDVNFFDKIFFFDIFSIITIIRNRNDPNLENIIISHRDTAKYASEKLEESFSKELNLKSILFDAFKFPYLCLALWKLFWIVFLYMSAFGLIHFLLHYIPKDEKEQKDNTLLHIISLIILISTILSSICINQLRAESTRIGIQVRSSLIVIIYRKSLKINTVFGEICETIGLIGKDCNTIAESFVNLHYLWSTSLEIIIVILISFLYLGPIVSVPLLVLLLFFSICQYYLGQKVATLSKNRSKTISDRIYLISEVLTAIKLVKFYAWERYFLNRISNIRRREIIQFRWLLFTRSLLMLIVFISPILATSISLQMYLKYGDKGKLDAGHIFTILSLFNILRYPLLMLPTSIQTTRAAVASIKNVEKFLKKSEIPILKILPKPDEDTLILLTNCSYSWSPSDPPCLTDLSMQFSAGKIYAIVGDVGSGKTSLITAIMGQMYLKKGTMYNYGNISFVPNEPWILNATLRDNILFGSKYFSDRYRKTLRVCGLAYDLKILQYGDRTEIGERGMNLSLGQRHRVSIARAVYNNSDIVLLDDPLSCMDPRVGKHVFKECIQEFLKTKAVIFVTNQLQYLSSCDHIIVMKNGKCIEQGTFSTLIANDVDLASLVGQSLEIEDPHKIDDLCVEIETLKLDMEPLDSTSMPYKGNVAFSNEILRLETIPESDHSKASIGLAEPIPEVHAPTVTFSRTNTIEKSSQSTDANETTISKMMKQASTNSKELSKIIDRHQLSVLGNNLSIQGNTSSDPNPLGRAFERNQMTIHSFYALDNTQDNSKEMRKEQRKITKRVYFGFLNESINIYFTIFFALFFVSIHGIRLFSDYWIKFFMVDQEAKQDELNIYFIIVLAFFIGIFIRGVLFLWTITSKSLSFHKNMLEYILYAPMSFFEFTPLSKILHSFSGHLSMIDDQLTESAFIILQFLPVVLGALILPMTVYPILIPFAVVILALAIGLIWYFKSAELKLSQYEASTRPPIFSHLSATLEGLHSIRVFKVDTRFDAFNMIKVDVNNKALLVLTYVKCCLSLFIDILSSLLIYITCLVIIVPTNIDTSNAGLAMTNIMQLLLFGQFTAQAIQDFHISINSVDQLIHYRSSINPELPKLNTAESIPPSDWPQKGRIEFMDVTLRYHRFELAVLKHVSFIIEPNEKVAIVGCTGSGKTTLLTSILRMVEVAEGMIQIDDVDITTVTLEELRRKIAVIPNEPVLFFGTIRSNLDPYNILSDLAMWNVLKSVHLFDKVQSMPLGLDSIIKENGTIFTYGQRQLLCIARTILLKCRIVILDEATSALDLNTEKLIQDIITKSFMNNTVLYVTHRLNTIIDADKVLVMNNGKLVEFDKPDILLNDENSKLYSLISSYTKAEIQNMQNMATLKSEKRLNRKLSFRSNSFHSDLNNSARSNCLAKDSMPVSLENVFIGPKSD